MRFPDEAPYAVVAIVAGLIAAALVIAMRFFAGELCARAVLHFC